LMFVPFLLAPSLRPTVTFSSGLRTRRSRLVSSRVAAEARLEKDDLHRLQIVEE
jgi:hypothetical protein